MVHVDAIVSGSGRRLNIQSSDSDHPPDHSFSAPAAAGYNRVDMDHQLPVSTAVDRVIHIPFRKAGVAGVPGEHAEACLTG